MDFAFSDEQQMLCETVRGFAGDHFGSETARARLAGEWKEADAVWREMAELGWLGLLVPESLGGVGGCLVDAVILVEQLTRALAPVPFSGNAILAASALARLPCQGGERLLGELAAGRRFSVVLSRELDWPPDAGAGVAWQWMPDAVPLLAAGDTLVAGSTESATPITQQDVLHGCAAIDTPGLDPAVAGSDAAQRFVATARVATSAALVGAMAGALDLCTSYASEREQFGQKIGSFQAIAHLCADMLVDLESSRSALYGAAWAVDHLELPAATRQASIAKVWCSEAGRRVGERAVQVHGGIGCTWESDVHLYLRVAHLEAAAFGGPERALEAVAAASLGPAQRSEHGPR